MTWLANITKLSNLSIFPPKRKKLKTWRKFGSGNTITFSVECQHRDISRLSFASTKTPHRKKSILKVISRRSQLLVFIAVCKLLSWECHNYNSFRINCNFSPRSEDLRRRALVNHNHCLPLVSPCQDVARTVLVSLSSLCCYCGGVWIKERWLSRPRKTVGRRWRQR